MKPHALSSDPGGRGGLWLFLTLVLAPVLATAARAEVRPAYEPRQHYTKYEYRIPMRDGVRLFTAVYVPKDDTATHPFLIMRTPYSVAPYGPDEFPEHLGPNDAFALAGYIFVDQDVRGRWQSEGTWIEMTPHRPQKSGPTDVDESTDTYDTVDWLLKNVPGHNGRAGLWGISYPGFYTSAGIIDTHPAIKAASPQAPVTDLYRGDDTYRGGAFMLAANFDFYTGFKPQAGPLKPGKAGEWDDFDYGTSDGYEFFLNLGPIANAGPRYFKDHARYFEDQIFHTTYDEYWKPRSLAPHLKNIRCAVLTVGGWFDAEDLAGPLATYRAIGEFNPGTPNHLVMGPWVHGGWLGGPGRRLGAIDFAADNSTFFQESILLPFFEQHLKDQGSTTFPGAWVFETGTNVWRRHERWPAPGAQPRTLYFQPGGRLAFTPPPSSSEPAFDRYVSDPARPVPFVGYTTLGVPQEYMVSDQRFASRRPDVLTYSTEPLEEDVTISGPLSARLFAATSGTDADWVVKLVDVYPPDLKTAAPEETPDRDPIAPPASPLAGYQQLVRGGPLRGKFRRSLEKPEPSTPGRVEEFEVPLADVNHTFRRGHRIMVQVQSSWFPLVDRNPQTFTDIPRAKPEDFRAATQDVHHSASQASGLKVLVLPPPRPAGPKP